METKGNPVDSVIQYQLHKKTSGESGDSVLRKLEFIKIYDSSVDPQRIITQDDIDNYLLYIPKYSVGQEIDKIYELNITKDELLSGKIIAYLESINREDEVVIYYDSYYREFISSFDLLAQGGNDKTNIVVNVNGNYYSGVYNVNLRAYLIVSTPTPTPNSAQ